MAWTRKQLEALERAIADGTQRVEYNDKVIVYKSLDEMMRIRDMMRRELGSVEKTTRLKSSFSKGLDTTE